MKDYFNKVMKGVLSSKGTDSAKIEPMPYRDWKIIVLSFFGGLVLSLGFNIYMSYQINNDNFFTTSTQKQAGPTLNREGLGKVLAGLAAKEDFLAKPIADTTIVDPSR